MLVFLHSRPSGNEHDWLNENREFEQIPTRGECILLKSGQLCRVQHVIHCQSEDSVYVAEVFTVHVDQIDAMQEDFDDLHV